MLAGFASAAVKGLTGVGKEVNASADNKLDKSPDTGDDGPTTTTITSRVTDDSSVKRGRGRPPKPGGPAPKKPTVYLPNGEPRKRGRPRKEDGTEPTKKIAKTTKATTAADTERRGRPKRDETTTKPAAKAAPKAKTTPKSTKTRGGKKPEPEEEDEGDDDDEDDED